jgi:Tfp pilus assembly protein PilV
MPEVVRDAREGVPHTFENFPTFDCSALANPAKTHGILAFVAAKLYRHIGCSKTLSEFAQFGPTMTLTRITKAQSGFTILEAMIASIILGLALGSVVAVASQCMRYLTDIRRTARSSQVLQQKMEDIRLLSWSQLQALPSTFTDPNDTNHVYTGTITQTAYDSYSGTTTVMNVTLTVTWTNQVYRVLTNSLSTLVSNGGLNKYIF